MAKRARRTVIKILVTILIVLLSIEMLLRIFDPWRVLQYANDGKIYLHHLAAGPETRIYAFEPGSYRMSDWTLTILIDRTRFVPHTHESNCRIALVGDSVTMGQGVSDDQTWADLLAQKHADIWILNTGVTGYGVQDALLTIQSFKPVDGYLYLLIDNDSDAEFAWGDQSDPGSYSAISLYRYFGRYLIPGAPPATTPSDPLPGDFDAGLRKILALPKVMVVGFDYHGLASRAARVYHQVHLIPPYTHQISIADAHPNADGHAEIAGAIAPYLEQLADEVCPKVL